MKNDTMISTITAEAVVSKIYLIRGQKVMLDRDLAELYGVETRRLNEQVKRNIRRFPMDFMFQLTELELEDWKSQNATSKKEIIGLRKLPFVFTEQGVAMLSSVLNSERAIEVNICIIRIFTKMREILYAHKDILVKLEEMEKKLSVHDSEIQVIFNALKQLLNKPPKPRQQIGFKQTGKSN